MNNNFNLIIAIFTALAGITSAAYDMGGMDPSAQGSPNNLDNFQGSMMGSGGGSGMGMGMEEGMGGPQGY